MAENIVIACPYCGAPCTRLPHGAGVRCASCGIVGEVGDSGFLALRTGGPQVVALVATMAVALRRRSALAEAA